VSTGVQTQAISHVSTVDAGTNSEVAPPEPVEDPREESVQHLYEAGLAKLDALHNRWAAAVKEMREAPAVAA
jgi:hypothetical protein